MEKSEVEVRRNSFCIFLNIILFKEWCKFDDCINIQNIKIHNLKFGFYLILSSLAQRIFFHLFFFLWPISKMRKLFSWQNTVTRCLYVWSHFVQCSLILGFLNLNCSNRQFREPCFGYKINMRDFFPVRMTWSSDNLLFKEVGLV